MTRIMRPAGLAAVIAAGLVAHAGADTITVFSDRPSFDAAIGVPLAVETFTPDEHFPITTGVLNSATDLVVADGPPITPGLILPGVTYSTPVGTGDFFNIDAGARYSGGFLDRIFSPGALTANFDSPVIGFGFDTNDLMGPFSLSIQFTSGPDFSQQFAGAGFYGFVGGSADIQSVTIMGTNSTFSFDLDNFTFPGPVPEPSSLALAGLGSIALIIAARRRRVGR